jgi:ribosomal protein S12 methylthiotransferase accessory factor
VTQTSIAPQARERTRQEEGLEKLRTFLSPYTGVVQWADELLTVSDDARISNVVCEMASRTLTLNSGFPMSAGSAHYRRDAALAGAIGEALERYSASYLPSSRFVMATAREIGAQAVTPERFALFSEEQYASDEFQWEPFTSDTKLCWVKGWSLPDREEVYLPQQLAYMAYDPGPILPGETPIGVASSSGLSLALDRDDAVLGGLLELVERDAIMLTWLNSLALPRLDWSGDPEVVQRDRRHFAPSGLPYEVIDLSVWCAVPTAVAIQRGPAGSVPYAMGGASAPTMQEAWDKAMRECFQGVTMLRFKVEDDPAEQPTFRDDYADITDPEDHCLFYLLPGNEAHAEFLLSSVETSDIREVPALEGDDSVDWIAAIARRLEAIGSSAYAVDVTSPDLQDAGLYAMRVIAPELQPIDFEYQARFLGGKRLYEAAQRLGLRSAPLRPDEINPYPHPFP